MDHAARTVKHPSLDLQPTSSLHNSPAMPMTLNQQRAWNDYTKYERRRDFIIEDECPPKYTSNEPVPVYLPPHLQSHKWYLDETKRLFNPFDWHFYHDFASLQLLYQRHFINAEDVCTEDARRLSRSPRCAPDRPHSWNDEQKDWWLRIYWQKYRRESTIKRNTAFREFVKLAEYKSMYQEQVKNLQARYQKQTAKRGRDEDDRSVKAPADKKLAIVDATGQQIAVNHAIEDTQAKNSDSQEPQPDEEHMRAIAEYRARNHLIPCPNCSVIHRKSRPITGRLNKSPKITTEPCTCTDSETCLCNKEAGDTTIPSKKRYWYDYNGHRRNIVVPTTLNPAQTTQLENGPRQNPKHWSLTDRDVVRSKSLKSKNKPVIWWNLIGKPKGDRNPRPRHPLMKVMNFGEAAVEKVNVFPRLQREDSFASTITATEDGENSDDDDAMEGVVPTNTIGTEGYVHYAEAA